MYGRSRVKPILTQREIQYSDGGVNNLSAVGFKSKSAFSMKLLMTLFKDREKNKIVWKITSKADFNSKGDTIIAMVA